MTAHQIIRLEPAVWSRTGYTAPVPSPTWRAVCCCGHLTQPGERNHAAIDGVRHCAGYASEGVAG